MTTTALEFDPFSDEYFNDPTDVYRRLRDEAPCYHHPTRDLWVLSRFDDIVEAYRALSELKQQRT